MDTAHNPSENNADPPESLPLEIRLISLAMGVVSFFASLTFFGKGGVMIGALALLQMVVLNIKYTDWSSIRG